MSGQIDLFAVHAAYCIDTNVILSFMKGTDDEQYGSDVFKPQWDFLELKMVDGTVVAPRQVETELDSWTGTVPTMKAWLWAHRHMFRDVDSDEQLDLAKRIVNAYPAYGQAKNWLGDLEVITMAGAKQLTVLTLESSKATPSRKRPKIPDVCREFGVGCVTFAGFLRREGFGR